jgi:pimeloyl-ACP methyl ester carboxylesterase
MKRWELWLAAAGLILLLLGAHWIRQGDLPHRQTILQSLTCRTPVEIFDPPPGVAPAGSIIMLHGLSANRRLMYYLGQDFAGHGIRAYLPDLPGHGDNTDSFSFARAEDCSRIAVELIIRENSLDPAKTILLGHSMGGAIAVRMADEIPLAATVSISPAPMTLPRRMPANLLVFSAQLDVWALTRQAAALQQAAGGLRTAQDDFAQRRAFELDRVPLATHTSMLNDRSVVHRSELWAMQALYPAIDPKTLALNLDLSTYGTFGRGRFRLAGDVLGLVGIGLILPLSITIAAKCAGTIPETQAGPVAGPALLLAEGAFASLLAVLILLKFIPLKFLHLYAGDYLASEASIVAVILLILNRANARTMLSARPRQLFSVAILALAALLGIGAWFNWQLSDLWLNAPRWLRFAELLPFAFLFCYTEESILGPVGSGKPRFIRFLVFLAIRLEMWLACIVGFFVLASGQILLPILVAQFAAFSIAQGIATDELLHRTRSTAAAALFGAILAAWFVAAVFPLT